MTINKSSLFSRITALKRPVLGGVLSVLAMGVPAWLAHILDAHGLSSPFLFLAIPIFMPAVAARNLGYEICLKYCDSDVPAIAAGALFWFCAGALIAHFIKHTRRTIGVWVFIYLIAGLYALAFLMLD